MTLRQRMFLLVVIFLGANLLGLFFSVNRIRIIGDNYRESAKWAQHSSAVQELAQLLGQFDRALVDYFWRDRRRDRAGLEQLKREIDRQIEKFRDLSNEFSKEEQEEDAELDEKIQPLLDVGFEVASLIGKGQRSKAVSLYNTKMEPIARELNSKLDRRVKEEADGSALWAGKAREVARRALREIAVAFVFVLLVCAFALLLLARYIQGRIDILIGGFRRVSTGGLDFQLDVQNRDEFGKLISNFNAMARDLLDRDMKMKRSQETMLRSDKLSAIGQLAAGVAHEINNPLGIILGFAQSMTRRIKADDPLALPANSIVREALRCKNLVQDLLIFSRESKSNIEEYDLNKTIESTLSLVEAQAKVKMVEVSRELGVLPLLMGDKNKIQQVIVNLCSNAIDAMPKGGKILIRTRRSGAENGKRVILEVEDNGSGVPEEIRGKIFNPFFTTKEAGKGTGLGLSLVYEIIQKHRGTIEVKSEVGQGTTFSISLPLDIKDVQAAAGLSRK